MEKNKKLYLGDFKDREIEILLFKRIPFEKRLKMMLKWAEEIKKIKK